jgi:hypothetical protein
VTSLDEFLTGVVEDCVNGGSGGLFTGDQGDAEVRAVQLRPQNFSPAMIQKAGRLFVAESYLSHDIGSWSVWGDSGEAHEVRVWGQRVWFATCTCPARASRYNRAGACAHRALGGWLRARQTGEPIPRWPAMTLEEWT